MSAPCAVRCNTSLQHHVQRTKDWPGGIVSASDSSRNIASFSCAGSRAGGERLARRRRLDKAPAESVSSLSFFLFLASFLLPFCSALLFCCSCFSFLFFCNPASGWLLLTSPPLQSFSMPSLTLPNSLPQRTEASQTRGNVTGRHISHIPSLPFFLYHLSCLLFALFILASLCAPLFAPFACFLLCSRLALPLRSARTLRLPSRTRLNTYHC